MPTLNESGHTTSIEEEKHLLMPCERIRHGRLQGSTEEVQITGAQLVPHVNYLHGWKASSSAYAFRQLEQLRVTGHGTEECAHVRGGAAENEHRPLGTSQCPCNLAGMIAWRGIILFVGPLMFFVQYEQARALKRGKECAPRSDDDVRLSLLYPLPFVPQLALREPAVQ